MDSFICFFLFFKAQGRRKEVTRRQWHVTAGSSQHRYSVGGLVKYHACLQQMTSGNHLNVDTTEAI